MIASSPENEIPRERRNLRNAVAFSATDEAWWQEYGMAMDAFHDKVRRLDLPKSR